MKLMNLLIRELNNCSLRGNFRVSHNAEICQFDRFSLEINFKRARSCNYGIPRLDSNQNVNIITKKLKKTILIQITLTADILYKS